MTGDIGLSALFLPQSSPSVFTLHSPKIQCTSENNNNAELGE